ncbi:hypothetical protein [Scytonema sp. PCC 10023]|jgi:transposase InsO family protein|uniref:hypothetical protein n=1 Tax=Scytonema sp. PCC 10023 TaxID=1680591 RepID=UPI0039C68749
MVFQFSVQNNLVIEHSNSCWICDFTCLDVLLAEQNGSVVGRPWLTLVIDVYSTSCTRWVYKDQIKIYTNLGIQLLM